MKYRLDKSAWLNRAPENDDPLSELVYAREVHAFRKYLSYFATDEEASSLMDEACAYFNVPRIRLVLTYGETLGGRFKGFGTGIDSWAIELRGSKSNRWRRWWWRGRDKQCRTFTVSMVIPPHSQSVHTFLHEFAHYLAVVWWNHHRHDALYASVEEMMHEWFGARRGSARLKRGRAITYTREKE